jgi:hypothetical protein
MISERIIEEMQAKLANGTYEIRWSNEEYKKNREKYKHETEAARQRFKSDLFVYLKSTLGEVNQEQFESVFAYAWEAGHSAGYSEVWLHFVEIVELISKFTGRTKI